MRRVIWALVLFVMIAAELSLYSVEITGEGHLDQYRAQRAGMVLAVYAIMTACWGGVVLWLVRRRGELSRGELGAVLAAGLLLAVLLWGMPATMSNDSFRYRWEGLASVQGQNAYLLSPDMQGQLKRQYPDLYRSLDFGWRPTIYPPFAQMLFAANAIFGSHMFGLRVILLGFHIVLMVGAWHILRQRGLPAGWLAAVALCPLLLIETHLDGHIEVVAVGLTVMGAAALFSRQWCAAAVLLGLAVDVKYFWPGLTALLLIGELRRQRRLLAGAAVFAVTVAILWLPFIMTAEAPPGPAEEDETDIAWMPDALEPIFKAPREFISQPNFNAVIFDAIARRCGDGSPWPSVVALAIVLSACGLIIVRRRWRIELEDIVLVLGTALLLAPASYPWYFLWLTPGLLAIGRRKLWSQPGPLPWAVVWLAMTPVLHEYLEYYFHTSQALPWRWGPWLVLGPVLPLLAAGWVGRLTEPLAPRNETVPTDEQPVASPEDRIRTAAVRETAS